ncbi:MAG: hypothetical protein MJ249_09250, partial [Kiritimatiellae bacterium]|nr:hypothetical protein [Kiritimatiellia bacterium]
GFCGSSGTSIAKRAGRFKGKIDFVCGIANVLFWGGENRKDAVLADPQCGRMYRERESADPQSCLKSRIFPRHMAFPKFPDDGFQGDIALYG